MTRSLLPRHKIACFSQGHEVWCTISGTTILQIQAQLAKLLACGVHAIEFRLDLIPEILWAKLLKGRHLPRPWWIAHFGTGVQSALAKKAISMSLNSSIEGCICHSRCEFVGDIKHMCLSAGKLFSAPYHSQKPLTRVQILKEYNYQETFRPSFRKIAIRAKTALDAAAVVQATYETSMNGGSPVVGAVFGPERWARVALPNAGSAVTFLVANRVKNEVGGDDEQFQVNEFKRLIQIRGIFPPLRPLVKEKYNRRSYSL